MSYQKRDEVVTVIRSGGKRPSGWPSARGKKKKTAKSCRFSSDIGSKTRTE